jgi:hypothetical protein
VPEILQPEPIPQARSLQHCSTGEKSLHGLFFVVAGQNLFIADPEQARPKKVWIRILRRRMPHNVRKISNIVSNFCIILKYFKLLKLVAR